MKAFIDENNELLLTAETPEEAEQLGTWKDQTPRVSNVQRKLEQGIVAINLTFTSARNQ